MTYAESVLGADHKPLEWKTDGRGEGMTPERLQEIKNFLDGDYVLSLEIGSECVEEIERLNFKVTRLTAELQHAQIKRDVEFWRTYADETCRNLADSNGKFAKSLHEEHLKTEKLESELSRMRQALQQDYMTDPLALAVLFHHTYEKLAPESGYETRKETRIFNPETPNGQLMIRVCKEIQAALGTVSKEEG